MDKSENDDFTCPICLYILIHPVTMPCTHSLCMPCYKQCVEKTNLTCPLCRMRISSWARKHSRSNTLVDSEKWDIIQKTYPVKVQNRLEDKDESSDDEWGTVHYLETELRKRKEVSKPGELRREYEAALAQLRRQQEEEKRKEEEASAALIRALQDEEEEEIAELDKQRELNEKKGIETALQLDMEEKTRNLRPVSCTTSKSSGSNAKSKASSKPKRPASSCKLDTFFETIRHTSSSAPLLSEGARAPSVLKVTSSSEEKELSPYPYICISPCDKRVTNPSPSECSSPEWNVALDQHLSEHSYTTASARRVDLTSESMSYMSCRRCDTPVTQTFVKMEPLDSNSSPECEDPVSSFQPIESFVRTPPRQLPSGRAIEPCLVRAVPRNLRLNDPAPATSSTRTATETISKPGENGPTENEDPGLSLVHSTAKSPHQRSTEVRKQQTEATSLTCFQGSGNMMKQLEAGTASPRMPSLSTSKIMQSNMPECSSNSNGINSNLNSTDDDIITDDMPLLIPMEPDLSVCNIENEYAPLLNGGRASPASNQQKPVVKRTKLFKNKLLSLNNCEKEPMLQETRVKINGSSDHNRPGSTSYSSQPKPATSKSKGVSKSRSRQSATSSSKLRKVPESSTMSIRQFCVPSDECDKPCSSVRKRKASDYDDIFTIDEADTNVHICDNPLDQEEADRLYALQLQNMYCTLDKHDIKVDRYKGAKDEYLLRKRKCI